MQSRTGPQFSEDSLHDNTSQWNENGQCYLNCYQYCRKLEAYSYHVLLAQHKLCQKNDGSLVYSVEAKVNITDLRVSPLNIEYIGYYYVKEIAEKMKFKVWCVSLNNYILKRPSQISKL